MSNHAFHDIASYNCISSYPIISLWTNFNISLWFIVVSSTCSASLSPLSIQTSPASPVPPWGDGASSSGACGLAELGAGFFSLAHPKHSDQKNDELMWIDVNWCELMWIDVNWCELMWTDVDWCGLMWTDVDWCGLMWIDVNWCELMWIDVNCEGFSSNQFFMHFLSKPDIKLKSLEFPLILSTHVEFQNHFLGLPNHVHIALFALSDSCKGVSIGRNRRILPRCWTSPCCSTKSLEFYLILGFD